jgi:hypothetical protein
MKTPFGLFLAAVLISPVWSDPNMVVGNPGYTTPDLQEVQSQIQGLKKDGSTPQKLLPISAASHLTHTVDSSGDVIELNTTPDATSAASSIVKRPISPSRPVPLKPRNPWLADANQLMDTSSITPDRLASQCGYSPDVLNGANTASDRQLVAESFQKLDGWFPGWVQAQISRNVSIVISDGVTNASAQSCFPPDGSYNYILINRSDMMNGQLPSLVFLMGSLAHEAQHIEDKQEQGYSWTFNPQEEATAQRQNVAVYRLAANDPEFASSRQLLDNTANWQAFGIDALLRGDIPYTGPPPNDAYAAPYKAALLVFSQAMGLDDTQFNYVSSQRLSDGSMALQFQRLEDNSTIKVSVDATNCSVTIPLSDTQASVYNVCQH